jgi:secretion/DNA translocation related TadE-like protein
MVAFAGDHRAGRRRDRAARRRTVTWRRRRPTTADRGSASIWVVACCALLMLVAAAAVVRAQAVFARHRAEVAADLAALAAAQGIGLSPAPCAQAVMIARRNGARVRSCRLRLAPDGRSGEAVVRVDLAVRLPLVGARSVPADARAARLPAGGCVADRNRDAVAAVAC